MEGVGDLNHNDTSGFVIRSPGGRCGDLTAVNSQRRILNKGLNAVICSCGRAIRWDNGGTAPDNCVPGCFSRRVDRLHRVLNLFEGAGLDLASRYIPPKNLDHRPRYHVRVRFPHPIPGPLAIGAGRYRGLGLFAAETD